MLLSLRPKIEVPNGRAGNRLLMALAARPRRRGDDNRYKEAMKVIENYSATEYFRQYGVNEPGNPRDPKRSRQYQANRLHRLFGEFEQSMKAGKMFMSTLAARDPGAIKRGYVDVLFRHDQRPQIRIPAVSHVAALNEINMASQPNYVRWKHWDSWIPTIHIAAAFAEIYEGNVALFGAMPIREFCRNLLFREETADAPRVIVNNANRLLQAAEDCALFPNHQPSPLVLLD